jgi:hypothetical protein
VFFAECLKHSAKAILHSENFFIGKGFFDEYFFRTLGKDFAECQKALGKEKHSTNNKKLKKTTKHFFKF